MKYIFLLLAIVLPLTGFAHQGKLDAKDCHNNKSTGQYECHGIKVKTANPKAKSSVKSKAKTSAKVVSKAKAQDYNCVDFATKAQAQAFFIKSGGPTSDPYDLDRDKDGKACETLK